MIDRIDDLRERVVEIPSGDAMLHGIFRGGGKHATWGIVCCDPFGEEKKCSHRALSETARRLADAQFDVLRFDYRGTGDSPGEFHEFTPMDWKTDIVAAAEFMRRASECVTIGFLGLRLGGTLGLQVAAETGLFDFALLWEPVVSGEQYLKLNLRRSMIKAMMTKGAEYSAEDVRARHDDDRMLDFDGYLVSQETREQIGQIDLLGHTPAFHGYGRLLVLNLSSRQQIAPEYAELAGSIDYAYAEAVRQEPFWNRIGLVDPSPAIEATAVWLAEVQIQVATASARTEEGGHVRHP